MRTFLYVLTAMVLMSCGSEELSREKAAEIIAKKYPKTLDWDIFRADPSHAARALGSKLETEGYIKVQKTQSLAEAGQPFITFTEKAQPYLIANTEKDKEYSIQKVKIGELHFKEITSIQMDGKGKGKGKGQEAIVEYTIEHKNNTPFAELTHYKLEGVEKEKALLVLSDKGWEIAAIK
ncbi:hypothetical protein SAMN05444266_10275 [Chitinophaga jiangningensis]|uniref:Lipoprotein n=1 Tax=Chitinophaga jiangningensis TaxID=1419482 RepID=A0A1M6XYV8_9BACT|nr:hypothetical protein [Chitinophaga jiangningensis]SHL11033.1 hypothetical protein SAMN05444266_10275 [Chitinophaga jiangningensis]